MGSSYTYGRFNLNQYLYSYKQSSTQKYLAHAFVNFREIYIVMQDIDTSVVYCIIAVVHIQPKGYSERVFCETDGVGYYNCPARLLNMLTPTKNEYALAWRQNCRARIQRRKDMCMVEGAVFVKAKAPERTITLTEHLRGQHWHCHDDEWNVYRTTKHRLIKCGYTTAEQLIEESL